MLTVTRVVRTSEEVVAFLESKLVESEIAVHPLLHLSFETRVELHDKVEEFFKGAMVTSSQWSDRFVRIIVPDHRSEKKAVYFDFEITAS